jgi:hypothetical protein
LAVVAVTQVVPAQQPAPHDVESHTLAPATHLKPPPHGALAPHWHVPLSQLSAELAVHAKQACPDLPHTAVVTAVTHELP